MHMTSVAPRSKYVVAYHPEGAAIDPFSSRCPDDYERGPDGTIVAGFLFEEALAHVIDHYDGLIVHLRGLTELTVLERFVPVPEKEPLGQPRWALARDGDDFWPEPCGDGQEGRTFEDLRTEHLLFLASRRDWWAGMTEDRYAAQDSPFAPAPVLS